jgi:rhodanese-related sulfurtransferase
MLLTPYCMNLTQGYLRLQSPLLRASASRILARSFAIHDIKLMTVIDFSLELKRKDPFSNMQLVDVREPKEIEVSYFQQQNKLLNLPLSQIESWSKDIAQGKLLDPKIPTAIVCRGGMRSMKAAEALGKFKLIGPVQAMR